MRKDNVELTFKERLDEGLARHWKMATVIFFAILVMMTVILVLDHMNKNKIADSAMLAEDIQEAYMKWIQETSENRDSTNLEEIINKALDEYPKFFAAQKAYFIRGLMALENKEWDNAVEAFIVLVDKWQESYLAPVSLYNAGSAKEESGDMDGAAELWQRLIDDYAEVSPDVPEALFNLGRLAETKGDTSRAIEFYKDTNSRFPKSRWTNLSKSRILILEGHS